MPFWSGETIVSAGEGLINPFDEVKIDCASYKLSMGREVYVTPQRDGLAPPYGDKQTLSAGQSFWIPPGQFAFLLTKESLHFPKDVLGFISLATEKKYSGLVNVSGFHVDPGFQGNLVFAVYNAGPKKIRLAEGDQLFLIWFADLDRKDSKHNRIDYKKSSQTEIASKWIQEVRGHPVTLQSVADDLKSVKDRFTLVFSIIGALVVIGSLLCAFLAVDWGEWHNYFHSNSESIGQSKPVSATAQPIANPPISLPQPPKP